MHTKALDRDSGQWNVAWEYTGLPGPLREREFVGTLRELEVLADITMAEASLRESIEKSNAEQAKEDE